MYIKILRGCVGNKQKLKTGEYIDIPDDEANLLIGLGFAKKTDKPKKAGYGSRNSN